MVGSGVVREHWRNRACPRPIHGPCQTESVADNRDDDDAELDYEPEFSYYVVGVLLYVAFLGALLALGVRGWWLGIGIAHYFTVVWWRYRWRHTGLGGPNPSRPPQSQGRGHFTTRGTQKGTQGRLRPRLTRSSMRLR